MKIAIPTNNAKKVSTHTALSKYIAVIEIENGAIKDRVLRKNPIPQIAKEQESTGVEGSRGLGAGRVIAELVRDADIFIAKDIGGGMKNNLSSVGIKVQETDKQLIDEIINEFLGG
jgi:predicted Fe-Mo cluster-binding NifX family protein